MTTRTAWLVLAAFVLFAALYLAGAVVTVTRPTPQWTPATVGTAVIYHEGDK